jgi:peptidoglycan/xylan/chitin deacetylase (PgdA/CDA1 family)
VGTHLWSHDRTTVHHEATFLDELRRSTALLSELSGHPTRWVRYPYGRQGASTHAILRRQDLAAVHWTVSSHDTRESDAGRIVARLDATIRRGAIVLMHDGIADEHTSPPKPPYLPTRDSGVAALPLLLRLLQSRGLSAVTLDELFA